MSWDKEDVTLYTPIGELMVEIVYRSNERGVDFSIDFNQVNNEWYFDCDLFSVEAPNLQWLLETVIEGFDELG